MRRAPLPLLAVIICSLRITTTTISCIRAITASPSSSSPTTLLGHHNYRGGGGRGEGENNINGYDEISMGTTILAVRYHGGIVTGADTRTSSNGYVANRHATKLTFVLDPMADDYYTSSTAVVMSTRTGDGGGKKRTKRRMTVVPSTRSRRRRRRMQRIDTNNKSVASTCVICRSGSASDTQTLASIVRCELLSRRLLHDVRGTVTHAASLLRTLLLRDDNDNNDSSMSASLICTGYDHTLQRGIVYTISKGGLLFEEQYHGCMGSGSTCIIGHLDSYYNNRRRHRRDDRDSLRQQQRLGAAAAAKESAAATTITANNNDTIKDTTNAVYNDDDDDNDDDDSLLPSEQEAIELVYTSIQLAMERDGSSGGFIRIYVIDKFGKRVVTRMMRNHDDDDDGLMNDSHGVIEVTDDDDERRRQVGGVTLRDFAPAISPLDF